MPAPGDPTLSLSAPDNASTVLPDFSAHGDYGQWDSLKQDIVCELELVTEGGSPPPAPPPLRVVATTTPKPGTSSDGSWEACFTAVPPGTYTLSVFFQDKYIPVLEVQITVAPYDRVDLRLDQVSLTSAGLLMVGGTLPAGVADAASVGLTCRAMHGGKTLDWKWTLGDGGPGRWSGTFTVPKLQTTPYVIHVLISQHEKHVRVARQFRYVVGGAPG